MDHHVFELTSRLQKVEAFEQDIQNLFEKENLLETTVTDALE